MPPRHHPANIGIACAVGGFKGVFLHGVLAALEELGFTAGAYAAASSSVVPAAMAAIGKLHILGLDHWSQGLGIVNQGGGGMSALVQEGIEQAAPEIVESLFLPGKPRFLIAANLVDAEGAVETQGRGARRLGRLLLLAAARGDHSWVDRHLTLRLFDSHAADGNPPITPQNFKEVAYASSRMLHAWDIPAWIDDRAYVDAFYNCACPAYELASLGYDPVIAISNEPVLYRDIFQQEIIRDLRQGPSIITIAPDNDPEEVGVSYTTATEEGLRLLYQHGLDKGRRFLAVFSA